MEPSKPIQQFVILSKTASGKACEQLINQVLSHKSIFQFGELLIEASIQQVRLDDDMK